MMTAQAAGPSLWARRLGYAGLIPFVSLAAALWVAPPGDWLLARTALLGYGATIASFLGAIHWGLVMSDAHAHRLPRLLWGVVPSLLGWTARLLEPTPGLLLMAALLWACYGVDRVLNPRCQLQAWLPMRLRLTLVASISCLAGAAALLQQLPQGQVLNIWLRKVQAWETPAEVIGEQISFRNHPSIAAIGGISPISIDTSSLAH